MAVSRDEFDKLVARVDRIEQTLSATVEIVSAEVVGLRTYLDEQFAHVDARLDGLDGRMDGLDGRMDGLDGRMDGLDGRMDGLDGRMDTLEDKLDAYTEQVQVAIRQGSDAAERHERFATAIADHFGIDLGDS